MLNGDTETTGIIFSVVGKVVCSAGEPHVPHGISSVIFCRWWVKLFGFLFVFFLQTRLINPSLSTEFFPVFPSVSSGAESNPC